MRLLDDIPKTEPVSIAVRQALRLPPVRVRSVFLSSGQQVWLKRSELTTGRMRLQKGNGLRALIAERDALRLLHAHGLPVPEIICEGPDNIVLPDAGKTLAQVLAHPAASPKERRTAFAAAGAALAGLHRAGLAHGRPALRDMCWGNGRLQMIDLERFRNVRRGSMVRALEVVIFTHSWFALRPGMTAGPELDAALDAYRAAAPRGLWAAVGRWTRLLAPLAHLSRGVLRLRPKARDWGAVAPTLAHLRGLTRDGG